MANPQHSCRLKQKEPHILILILMSSFASISTVILTPALPEIAKYFQISARFSQLTITLFLLGYATGPLIYGPLSNRLGRKPAFYIGMAIASFGSLVSISSIWLHSFGFLILGCTLEALGASSGLVIAFTMISDHYYPEQARRIIAYLMLAFAIMPGIATFVGGTLVAHFDWISSFYFLLAYGVLLIVPVYCLGETATILHKDALLFNSIKRNYLAAIKNKLLRNTTLFFSISNMCVYIYVANAPFIAIHYLKISAQKYGLIGLIPFIGTMCGSIFTTRLSFIFSAKTLMKIGLFVDLLVSVLLAVLFYFGFINLLVLVSCGFAFLFGNCLVVGNGASIATSTSEDKANASAIMNLITIGMPVCGTLIVALIPASPLIKIPISFLIAMAIMVCIWFKSINKNHHT